MKIVKIVVLLVLAAMIIGTLQHTLFAGKQEEESTASLCQSAYEHSKGLVTRSLKAPATAKFPDNPQSAYEAQALDSLGRRIVYISSYVDAQNSFGALLRKNYNCSLGYKLGSWYVIDIHIDD